MNKSPTINSPPLVHDDDASPINNTNEAHSLYKTNEHTINKTNNLNALLEDTVTNKALPLYQTNKHHINKTNNRRLGTKNQTYSKGDIEEAADLYEQCFQKNHPVIRNTFPRQSQSTEHPS